MNGDLPAGVYEQLLTAALADRLQAELSELADLHPAEAADRLAMHFADMVRRAVGRCRRTAALRPPPLSPVASA